MSQLEAQAPRRNNALALLVGGGLAFAVGLLLGPQAALGGAALFALTAFLALRELATPTVTWRHGIAGFVLFMWLIPAKGYRLPVSLPFGLEPYRLFLGGLVVAFVLALLGSHVRLRYAGMGAVLGVLAFAAALSAILNYDDIGLVPGDSGALKSLSYFLGFLLVFVLVSSTIRTHTDMDAVVRALVVGGTVVATFAIYESRSGFNYFDNLAEYFPFLVRESRDVIDIRGGNLRVYASAQHPIALSAALFMTIPLALYLVRRAASQARARLWMVAAGICAMGAVATISRTTVIMGFAMVAVGFWVRGREVLRFWPLLLVLPFAIHFATPGVLGGLWKSFFPQQGLTSDLYGRSGETGSGRFADIEPGLRLWEEAPLFGHGIGSEQTTGEAGASNPAANAEGAVIIFDNQWLGLLVSLGLVGLAATIWFVWGTLGKVGRCAKRAPGPRGDLAAACAASVGAFGASMFVFDAFAFIQATMLFFVIAALGLRIRELDRVARE